jgi:hypothetical protein
MVPDLASDVLKLLSALESTPGVAGDKHTLLSYGTDMFVDCEQNVFHSHEYPLQSGDEWFSAGFTVAKQA